MWMARKMFLQLISQVVGSLRPEWSPTRSPCTLGPKTYSKSFRCVQTFSNALIYWSTRAGALQVKHGNWSPVRRPSSHPGSLPNKGRRLHHRLA
jgi:hypothetical protein